MDDNSREESAICLSLGQLGEWQGTQRRIEGVGGMWKEEEEEEGKIGEIGESSAKDRQRDG